MGQTRLSGKLVRDGGIKMVDLHSSVKGQPDGLAALGADGGLGLGGPRDPSALFQVNSTEKGAILPRMNTDDRDAIESPATGLVIFNDETVRFEFYDGDSWQPLGSGGGGTVDATVVDNTGSRTLSVEYTNTTGHLLQVYVTLYSKVEKAAVAVLIGSESADSEVGRIRFPLNADQDDYRQLVFVVPIGWSYMIDLIDPDVYVHKWIEVEIY